MHGDFHALALHRIVLGIDLGDTIVHREQPEGTKEAFPGAIQTIAEFVRHCREVHIVSRVNPEQKVRAERWLADSRFHEATGLPVQNVHFCAERCEKGPICERLGVTHFIDDRPEVMSYLRDEVIKILHRPDAADLATYSPKLKNWVAAEDWQEIRQRILQREQPHPPGS